MLSICICSCLNNPDRKEYLKRCIDSIYNTFLENEVEILIGFDKYGAEIDGAKCHTHEKGMGHSWNWCIENATNDIILQTEDDWVIEIGGRNMERVPDKNSFFYHLNNRIKVIEEYGGMFKFTNIDDKFWTSGKTVRSLNGYNFKELNKPKTFMLNTWDMFIYSNQPHLKKKDFHKKVGFYLENVSVPEVEIDMCKKVYNSNERVFLNSFFTLVHIGFASSR